LILLLFSFFSHLIGFGILAFSIGFIALLEWRRLPRRALVWTGGILLATVPLVLNYLSLSRSEKQVSPQWNNLADPLSITSWIGHWAASDPFVLMSRRAFPFVDFQSSFFAILSPALWIVVVVLLAAIVTYISYRRERENRLPTSWLLLMLVLGLFWLFGPDDFGSEHGGFLRERVLIMAAVCVIPIIRLGGSTVLIRAATFILLCVLAFQTLLVWDYSLRTDRLAKEFLSAADHLRADDSLASVITIEDNGPFKAMPVVNLTPFIGIGKIGPVWDNYEFGYYLFPVVARDIEARRFVYDLRLANTLELYKDDERTAKMTKLEQVFDVGNQRIDVLLVWNEQPDLEQLRSRWFESEPYYRSGNIALYRRKPLIDPSRSEGLEIPGNEN
jgi:hypothetical protein